MAFQSDFLTGSVDVDGAEVIYYDSGPVEDRAGTIVLIHGTGGSAYGSFWALMPMLSFKYKVIAMDLVDVSGEETTLLDYADQAWAVISAKTTGPVSVLGYSLGAVIAAELASAHPQTVSDLVLVAGWVATDQHQLLRNDLWFRLRDEAPSLLPEFTVLTSFSHGFLASKKLTEVSSLIESVRNGKDRGPKMKVNRDIDLAETAERIRARTLVIGCTEDQMVPISHSHALFAAIPGATLVEIRSGHSVMHERAAEVFKRVHDFILEQDPNTSGTILPPIHA